MRIRILHIADTHLGMENYGRIDSATGLHTRLQDFANSLGYAVEYGIKESVDVCLFAGDAYRNSNPSPTHQREFADQINKLIQADIPVVMVVGNHDSPVSFGKASALEIFNTIGGENNHGRARFWVISRPEIFCLETKSGPLQIVALPWPSRSNLLTKEAYKNFTPEQINQEIERICTQFIESAGEGLDSALPSALLGHLTVAGATYCGSERTAIIGNDPVIMTSMLASPHFNYVALGHIHKFQDLNEGSIPPVVYPGSIDRVDFGEEKEEKGFCIAEVFNDDNSQRQAEYEFVKIPARPFISVKVELDNDDPTAQMLAVLADYDFKDAIVRITYIISDEKQSLLDLKMIHERLSDAFLVAGISRRIELASHKPRIQLNESLGLQKSLERYLFSQPDWKDIKNDLLKHASILEHELEENK